MSALDLPELGPEVSQHRYQASGALLYFGLAALCLLIWGAMTAIGISEVVTKRDWGALGATFCLGGFFGLPGLWLIYAGAKGLVRGAVVTIHEGGVSYRTRFRTVAWPWADVTALRINRVARRGRPAHEAFDAVTLFKGKEQLAFSESDFGHIPDSVLDLIRERTVVELLPRYEAALKRGETVTFGKAALSADEVVVGKHRFLLSDLAGWRFQQTDLVVFPKAGKARHGHIYGSANTHVLFQLLARRVPLRPRD